MSGGQSQARGSTSPDLSSPPSGNSPAHQPILLSNDFPDKTDTIQLSNAPAGVINGVEKPGRRVAAKDPSTPKRPRKRKETESKTANNTPIASNNGEDKPKKPRIPRGTGPQALKKKAEQEAKKARELAEALHAANNQSKLTESFPGPTPPQTQANVPHLSTPPQNGNIEAIPASHLHTLHSLTPQPRISSGQNYDPIRSSTVAPRPNSPMNMTSTPPRVVSTTTATRSPSISSLIDPPDTMRSSPYAYAPKRESEYRPSSPHSLKRLRISPPPSASTAPPVRSPLGGESGTANQPLSMTTPMDTDRTPPAAAATAPTKSTSFSKKPTPIVSKGPSPGSHSPKPTRTKEAPSLPTGSGLLSGSIFGGSSSFDSSAPEKTAPTVVIDVPLTGDNQYINFTRLAEEKYGFNALHPRLAVQRERLARVAAAGAALENAHKNGGASGMSADEMSVDLSNDEADNSNIEMGGVDERGGVPGMKSGEDTGEAPKRRKRIMKEDMYDKDDDFVDDTELAWEEQAAVSKDGFFVYSGPLVPEGEEAKVERAEGQPKRGRGGGRGRGGTAGNGGGRSKAAGAATANKETNKDGKPVQKRQRRSKQEIERAEREKAARKESLTLLASKPVGQPLPPAPQAQQQMQQMST